MESFVMLLVFLAASIVINMLSGDDDWAAALLRVVSLVGILASFLGLAFIVGTTLL